MFNKLKQFRHSVTHYDKTSLSFCGFLYLAAARISLIAIEWITAKRSAACRLPPRTASRNSGNDPLSQISR